MSGAMGRLERWRVAVWERRGVLGRLGWLALLPASLLFGVGVALRNLGYRIGVLPVERGRIPVVSVGNLSVGGTGKTPMTLWLARALADTGLRVAIVLRGYRGSVDRATVVSRGDGPEVSVDVVGDEAVMLAKCFPGVVVVAPRRIEGVTVAEGLGCEVVVLDDGFQHRGLARDFDLVLVSGRVGSLLPAGPMRESSGALRRATAVALVRKSVDETPASVDVPPTLPCFVARFVARGVVVSDAGVWHELPIETIAGRRVAVVSGIAHPDPFYATVRQWDAHIEEIFEYPDHYRYTIADWQSLSRDTRMVDAIVTTEKDLVKLEGFPFARRKLMAVRVVPEIEGGAELLRLVLARTGLVPGAAPGGGTHGDQ